MSARQWNTLTAQVMRLSQANRGRMRTLSNGAGIFTVPEPDDGMLFYNGDATTIPAYGVVLRNGVQAAGGPDFSIKAKRPDAWSCQENFLINGPNSVESTSWGNAQFGDGNTFIAAYDSADGTPAKDEFWGPQSGTYLLKKLTVGFIVDGVYDSTNHYVLVRSVTNYRFRGKPTADVPSLSIGTVNPWMNFNGTDTASTVNVSVYNGSSCTVKGGQLVWCLWDMSTGGTWIFDVFQTA